MGQERWGVMGKEVVAYDVSFDRKVYKNPSSELDGQMLDAYTRRQVETHIGERFNVVLSTSRYNIQEGTIFAEDMHEPFLDMMVRGRDYRKLHGDPIDHLREEAEVEGFRKVQDTLVNAQTGSMMLSISPPGREGSIYTHNFYDIFTVKQDQKGKYIEARRYSSSLSVPEYLQKLWDLRPDAKEAFLWASDAHLLSHPVFISDKTMNADFVHRQLHKDHQTMSEVEFSRIVNECKPFIDEYIKSLRNDPENDKRHEHLFRATLNKADEAAEGKEIYYKDHEAFLMDMHRLGKQEVRYVDTGCGPSGTKKNPFSVVEFGDADKYGSLDVECPSCGETNRRELNQLLPKCKHCGSGKIAC